MIFITLGSQKFQFNRLLKAIDKLVEQEKIKEEVFAQIGYSDYQPINYKYKQFLDRDEFADMEEKADIVITHGGTGAIIGAVKKGKKVIAVPRLAKYGEHVDNHQLQLLKEFEDMNIIVPSYNEGLPMAVLEAISYGLPVIATDVGDMVAAVRDGENGYLIHPGDVEAIADAILKVSNKNQYDRFSKFSKELAIAKFNEDRFFEQILKVYQG